MSNGVCPDQNCSGGGVFSRRQLFPSRYYTCLVICSLRANVLRSRLFYIVKFLIITHVLHKASGTQIGGYGPYIREMNLWLKHVDSVRVVAPIQHESLDPIDLPYCHPNLELVSVPTFFMTSPKAALKALFVLPIILVRIFQGMRWADHIHLRCPGNMGLLGCLTQILFPRKSKTAKYAGNWDPSSKQPLSYRFQRHLLANPVLTRNMQTLVYGEWPGQTRNIRPFFTATYHQSEVEPLRPRSFNDEIKLVFVGGLTLGKQPLLAVKVLLALVERGVNASLELIGEGVERDKLEAYVSAHHLTNHVRLLGNVGADTVKTKLQCAHFLIFLSTSEGWPKAVAEAMFWGCVPVTTRISCVPFMLGEGSRGTLIEPSVDAAVVAIDKYFSNLDNYQRHAIAATEWSRQFTLEKFEEEIVKLLRNNAEFLTI